MKKNLKKRVERAIETYGPMFVLVTVMMFIALGLKYYHYLPFDGYFRKVPEPGTILKPVWPKTTGGIPFEQKEFDVPNEKFMSGKIHEGTLPLNTSGYTTKVSDLNKYGIRIIIPAGWTFESNIKKYDTIAQAQKFAGNHFRILNYKPDQVLGRGGLPEGLAKIEVYVYDLAAPDIKGERLPQSLDEWVSARESEGFSAPKRIITIDGKEAVLFEESEKTFPVILFVNSDLKKAAIFVLYGDRNKFLTDFLIIAQSFQVVE